MAPEVAGQKAVARRCMAVARMSTGAAGNSTVMDSAVAERQDH